jgi:hypothetical protein
VKFLLIKFYVLIGLRPEGGRSFHVEPITVTAELLGVCRMSLLRLLEFVYLADECVCG